MKKIIGFTIAVIITFGVLHGLKADPQIDRAKHRLAEQLNVLFEATYDQGFIDGYNAGLHRAKEFQTQWDNKHS